MLTTALLFACGKDPAPPVATADASTTALERPTPANPPDRDHLVSTGEVRTAGATDKELEAARLGWKPTIPPNKTDVTAAPGVDVMEADKQNKVVVGAGELRFKVADHPDVATWEKGRVLVSGPADPGSSGKNPFGFARRVEKVEIVGDEVVVTTGAAALQEILHGEFQLEFDPATAREVEWKDFEQVAQWAASNLYTNTLPDLAYFPPRLRDDTTSVGELPPTNPGGDPFGCCVPKFISRAAGTLVSVVAPALNVVVNTAKDVGGAVVSGVKSGAGAVVSGVKAGAGAVKSVVSGAAARSFTAVNSIGEALAKKAKDFYQAVMPQSFGGTASLEPDFRFKDINLSIVKYQHQRTFNANGKLPFDAALSADANLTGTLSFSPKLSVGAEIPNPIAIGEKPPLRVWLDVSAQLEAGIMLDLALEATLSSAGGKAGSKLEEALAEKSEFAESVLNGFRKELFGNEDTKPAGNWKKTVFLSKPKVVTVFLGKVPVVMTGTFQIDIECGFEMKAQLDAEALLTSVHTFTYRAEYIQGTGIKQNPPEYNHYPQAQMKVLGAGEASVACSILPRINVFLYDTIGINAGIRASVIASAEYTSTCAADKATPDGEVELGLKAGIGIPVGARVQVPGSSWGGKGALEYGAEFGPIEIWNMEKEIWKASWDVPGLGYCTATCSNGKKGENEPETDLDCGGQCPTGCAQGKVCKVNSDCGADLFCVAGLCATSSCGDGVLSGDETDIDCGGSTCDPCKDGKVCGKDKDCAVGGCQFSSIGAGFVSIKTRVGVCVSDPCNDGQLSPGECGIDCGGKCKLCPAGAMCGEKAQCATAHSNGYQCTDSCRNLERDPYETDVDCGGATACVGCAPGKSCFDDRDCMGPDPKCTNGVCVLAAPRCGGFGERCCADNTCKDGLLCNGSACQCPADRGIVCGSACCGAGQLCLSGACVDPSTQCLTFSKERRDSCAPGMCPATCREILATNPKARSGVYSIQPDPSKEPFDVRCDMELDGGGWTLVGLEHAGTPVGTETGIMASLFAESGHPDDIAHADGRGFFGPRFSYTRRDYTHLRLKWCDPTAPKNLYQIFRTSEEIFADGARAENGTIKLSEFQSNDPVLNQQIPTPDSARFCRARTSTLFPGDTSWGVKGKDELNFGCGCNSGSWQGVGSYYGGTGGDKCTSCMCFGGGWSGTAGNGVKKGGISNHTFYLWIR